MHRTVSAEHEGCDAGIVFALPIEADAFERRVARAVELRGPGPTFHEGRIADTRIAWCVSGVGGAAASRATRLLIDGHRPRLLVSAGFAGGLDPRWQRGAVVRPTAVVAEDRNTRLALMPTGHATSGPVLVSVGEVAATVERKRNLAVRTGADLVDMETFAIAAAAATAGLPCIAVRVVSDDARQALPAGVAALARPRSALGRLGALVGTLGRRPAAALDLWRLYENAVVDGRALALELERLCGELAAGVSGRRPGAGPADSAAGRPPAP